MLRTLENWPKCSTDCLIEFLKLLHNGRTLNEESFETLRKMRKELLTEITEKIESTDGPDSLSKNRSDSKGLSIY